MKEIILENGFSYITVHLIIAVIGLGIELTNQRYLQVSDFVWSILFGPLYFLKSVWGLDKIVIDIRNKKP